MRRITSWDRTGIIDYNLRDGGTAFTVFADTQAFRVQLTHRLLDHVIGDRKGLTIAEPACSAGDITGPYAKEHRVWGCDVVPAAVAATRQRYPDMEVRQATADDMDPIECDILVLCEFLEHIDDPVSFVKRWFPFAKDVIISHPLVRDGHDPEKGHVWAYYDDDYRAWFPLGGHRLVSGTIFYCCYEMVLAHGTRT